MNDVAMHRALPTPRTPRPDLASFARALRQRGLITRVDSSPSVSANWSDTPDLWIAGNAIYEAHLRRVAMEQVLATLRRDSSEEI